MKIIDNVAVGKRLATKRSEMNISSRRFAMEVGVDVSQWAKIEKGELPLTENILDKLLEKHQWDKDYILFGTEIPNLSYTEKRRTLKNSQTNQVPMYGGYTTLGNIQVYDDEKMKHKVIAQLPAEVFPGCDFAEKAKGNSMWPIIVNQAILAGKTCTFEGIVFGEIYTVKTKKGLDTTKYVHPGSQKGFIKLVAYNKQIPDQEVKIEEIVFTYRVHFIINPT